MRTGRIERPGWVWLVGMLIGIAGVWPIETSADAGEESPWILKPARSLECLTQRCAIFYPQGGSPIPQGRLSDAVLSGDGELVVLQGPVVLERSRAGTRETFVLYRGAVRLTATTVMPLTPIRGEARRDHGPATRADTVVPTRLGLPPLVAGPEGTHYAFVMTPRGTLCLRVLEGRLRTNYSDRVLSDGILITPGQALYADHADLDSRDLELLEQTEAVEAFEHLVQVGWGPEALAGEGAGPAFARFTEVLLESSPTEAARAARELAQRFPSDEFAARALYLAAHKAETHGRRSLSDGLAEEVLRDFAEGLWSVLLASELIASDRAALVEAVERSRSGESGPGLGPGGSSPPPDRRQGPIPPGVPRGTSEGRSGGASGLSTDATRPRGLGGELRVRRREAGTGQAPASAGAGMPGDSGRVPENSQEQSPGRSQSGSRQEERRTSPRRSSASPDGSSRPESR